MPNFPMDVVTDILSRLPVKSLVRFRCVSKPWCALIDGRDFIKFHLNGSIKTKDRLSLVLRDSRIYSVDFDSLDRAVELDHPLKCLEFGTEVLGSCDGLLCLYNGEEEVGLWNPSTRQFHLLPVTEIESQDYLTTWEHIIYGLGYDSVSDDYKVVRMIQFYGHERDSFDSEVKVYSLKSNSWRRIQNFPYYLYYKRVHGMLVSGALHWAVTQKSDLTVPANLVAAFDLSHEEYRLVPQPEISDEYSTMNVGVLEGCLCILFHFFEVRVDVWVMREYGAKESWSKLFCVVQQAQQVNRCFDFVLPLTFSKSGSEVLLVQENKQILWFDLKQKTVKKLDIQGLPSFFETVLCVGSLVQLKAGGKVKHVGSSRMDDSSRSQTPEKEEYK